MPGSQQVNPFKKRHAGFSGFGTLAFGGRKRKKNPFNAAEVRLPEQESDAFEYTLSKIGDVKVTKAVLNLKQTYPNGTTPELVTMDWLNRNQIRYIYQAQYGARTVRGSSSTDFVVVSNGMGIAWEINGVYWHTRFKTAQSDASRALLLLNKVISGVKIDKVVALWEPDIYKKPKQVFEMALMGEGLRG